MPQFRGNRLAETAPLHGMVYEWMGEILGGLNDIATDDPAFLAALNRLLALKSAGPAAIFCSEGAATECHRSGKIGAALLVRRSINAINILRDDREELVSRTLLRTKPGNIPPCLRDAALKASMKAMA